MTTSCRVNKLIHTIVIKFVLFRCTFGLVSRGETRALIGGGGGGGEYSYLLVLPGEFLLKSAVIKANFKRNSSGRTRIYEYSPPPPN